MAHTEHARGDATRGYRTYHSCGSVEHSRPAQPGACGDSRTGSPTTSDGDQPGITVFGRIGTPNFLPS